MAHESRLSRELRSLLHGQRVAALGTLGEHGAPLVSMVPFAVEPSQACIVIHVSNLAAHTRNLQAAPAVSLLVMRAEVRGEPVHALPRVTLEGHATVLLPGSPAWQACRDAYLNRFAEAQPMTRLDDFMFVAIHVSAARQVAGFGAARSIDKDEFAAVLSVNLDASTNALED
jgi:heme iron utilization protein